jgi:rhodanese-related sulfurtransferase
MKKLLYTIFTIIMFSILFILNEGLLAQQNDDFEVISVLDASNLMDENNDNQEFIILDVRTEKEYKTGHIANSVNIDYKASDFKERVGKLDKDKTYLTYCRSGRRSKGASEIMRQLGFLNIIMIKGGMNAWGDAGLPVDQDK